ncbi:3-oxoacyl-[acyl-carrier-protein] reductase FabG-like isoform X1 [Haliotis rufescens]|uniref:3-oxoacyl-[acyl-carrier-protein] reductase FabG-like isoform X1 n=1 Tax=Haliotis rufescens TaxID=6454 RepID=UPI00201F3889|nr:3-oxoacyl-[acyl-carrier-protein] reductase FabG-like isoform X1 [Haliotis rufescens]
MYRTDKYLHIGTMFRKLLQFTRVFQTGHRRQHTSQTSSKPVAIVTGGSSGIGRGIAEELARTGYALTIHGRSVAGLNATADLCVAAGCDDILCVEGDLSKDDILENIPAQTLKKFGRIDALINNAGEAFHPDKMSLFDTSLFDRILSVNLRAPVVLSKHALGALKVTKGSILNISSVTVDNCRMLVYGVSKAGLEHFTKVLALEVASAGVRVNSIKPGALMTSVWGRFSNLTAEEEAQLEEKLTHYFHPIRRLTTQEDINHAVTFMLSDKASFITGASIPVTGGAHMPFDGRVLKHLERTGSGSNQKAERE